MNPQLSDIIEDLEKINKNLGNDVIFIPKFENIKKIEAISTGSIGLDYKLGIGGVPVGKITSVLGWRSTGKTTLCLHLAANAQKMGGLVAYIDGEHELDLSYARNLGVDIENLLIIQPDNMEDALKLMEQLAESNKFKLIIFDSIAALPTMKELEAEITDLQTADKAKLVNKHSRRMASYIDKANTAFVYINQYRDDISFGYGSGKTVPGGKAMGFRAAVEIDLTIITGQLKVNDKPIGSRIRAKTVKNKLAMPFQEWEYTIVWGKGIVYEMDLTEIATQLDIIKKKGPWYAYNGSNIGQGLMNVVDYLQSNKEMCQQIEGEVKTLLGVNK